MLSTVLTDMFDQPISTLIVCDGWPFVHLIQGDQVTMTIQTPSTIQSVCRFHLTAVYACSLTALNFETFRWL